MCYIFCHWNFAEFFASEN